MWDTVKSINQEADDIGHLFSYTSRLMAAYETVG
jgi:hypothetical protein